MAFYSKDELDKIGFKEVGKNVLISDKSSIYNPQNISIGNNVRIDDFCILSAGEHGIVLKDFIHIACYSSLIGECLIEIKSYSNISSRVSIYSKSDDFSGGFMTNPCVPEEYTNVVSSPVLINKHVVIGSGCVVLPGVTLYEGTAIGALSLVNKSCEANYIYAGTPLKKIKPRSMGYKTKEHELIKNYVCKG